LPKPFLPVLTAQIDDHHKASKILTGSVPKFDGDKTAFLEDLRQNSVLRKRFCVDAQGGIAIPQKSGYSVIYYPT